MQAGVDPDTPGKRQPGFGEFVALVAFMMGITAFAVDNLLPAFPALAARFSVADPNELQLSIYVYTFTFGAFQLVYGPLSDVIGRRPAFLTGLVIFAAGALLATVASTFDVLLAARALQGVGAAAGRVIAIAIVRDRFAGREMARVMSLTMVIFITVPIFAPTLGAGILAVADWRGIFATMLVLALALAIWFVQRMPETLRAEDKLAPSGRAILRGILLTLRCRAAVGYSTAFGCLFGCIMGYVASSQQIFAGPVYGLGNLFTLVFAGVALSMGLSALVNARLVRRYGMRRISHLSIMALWLLSMLQCGLAVAYSGHTPLLAFMVVLALSQFVMSLAMPNFNALAMEPLGHIAGTASSLIGCYTTILGVVLGSVVGQHFDGTVLPLGIGYLVLSSAVFAVVLLTEKGRLMRPMHPEPSR